MANKYYPTFRRSQTAVIKATAYTANTLLCNLWEIDLNVDRPIGGYIDQFSLYDSAGTPQQAAMNVYIFEKEPETSMLLGEAFAPTFAEQLYMPGNELLEAVDYGAAINGVRQGKLNFSNDAVHFYSEEGKLWVAFVPTGTPTYSATNVVSMAIHGLFNA
jgi:hypothetical protein